MGTNPIKDHLCQGRTGGIKTLLFLRPQDHHHGTGTWESRQSSYVNQTALAEHCLIASEGCSLP